VEVGKCKTCGQGILYLATKRHIQFGGLPPPVQKDDLCPKCWMKAHPNEQVPALPGWHSALGLLPEPDCPSM
jgi:hypothetical protein